MHLNFRSSLSSLFPGDFMGARESNRRMAIIISTFYLHFLNCSVLDKSLKLPFSLCLQIFNWHTYKCRTSWCTHSAGGNLLYGFCDCWWERYLMAQISSFPQFLLHVGRRCLIAVLHLSSQLLAQHVQPTMNFLSKLYWLQWCSRCSSQLKHLLPKEERKVLKKTVKCHF